VKTYMEDITDSSGRSLFDNLTWCTKKLCSVMTSVSSCEHTWSIVGWIHSKHKNRLSQTTVEKAVRVYDNLVLRKTMMERNKNVVVWDSQNVITELKKNGRIVPIFFLNSLKRREKEQDMDKTQTSSVCFISKS
jgi:hypothetical protein